MGIVFGYMMISREEIEENPSSSGLIVEEVDTVEMVPPVAPENSAWPSGGDPDNYYVTCKFQTNDACRKLEVYSKGRFLDPQRTRITSIWVQIHSCKFMIPTFVVILVLQSIF